MVKKSNFPTLVTLLYSGTNYRTRRLTVSEGLIMHGLLIMFTLILPYITLNNKSNQSTVMTMPLTTVLKSLKKTVQLYLGTTQCELIMVP